MPSAIRHCNSSSTKPVMSTMSSWRASRKRQPDDFDEFARRSDAAGDLAGDGARVGEEKSRIEAARKPRRGDRAGHEMQVLEGREDPLGGKFAPGACGRRRRCAKGARAEKQAGLFESLADRGERLGAGPARGRPRNALHQLFFDDRRQRARHIHAAVLRFEAAAGEHVFVRAENVAGVTPAHQNLRHPAGAVDQDQRRRRRRPHGAARARCACRRIFRQSAGPRRSCTAGAVANPCMRSAH